MSFWFPILTEIVVGAWGMGLMRWTLRSLLGPSLLLSVCLLGLECLLDGMEGRGNGLGLSLVEEGLLGPLKERKVGGGGLGLA